MDTTPPAGWYADPAANSRPDAERYWDGNEWTSATRNAERNHAVEALIPVGRPWQAVAAGYVAIFALLIWPLGPIALFLGVLGWRATGSGASKKAGRGRAGFAIAVGVVTSIIMAFILLV